MGTSMHKTFIPSDEMIKINSSQCNLTIKKGQQLYFSSRHHSSVGINVACEIDNESLLKLISTTVYQNTPLISGKTGGDNGQKVFIFEAIDIGKTNLLIKKIYRGTIKEEITIVIDII